MLHHQSQEAQLKDTLTIGPLMFEPDGDCQAMQDGMTCGQSPSTVGWVSTTNIDGDIIQYRHA